MDQTPEQKLVNQVQRTKKVWAEPQLYLINQANVAGGTQNGAHEKYFTPNHTKYHKPGSSTHGPFATTFFNKYFS